MTSILDDDATFDREYTKVKKTIFNYFSKNGITDKLTDLIDNSEFVEFKSVRSKKFLNKHRPTFLILIKWEMLEKFYEGTPIPTDENSLITSKVTMIQELLLTPLMSSMGRNIIAKEKDVLLGEISSDLKDLERFIVSSIFTVDVDGLQKDSICSLRLFA